MRIGAPKRFIVWRLPLQILTHTLLQTNVLIRGYCVDVWAPAVTHNLPARTKTTAREYE